MNWISIEEDLPNENDIVLVCDKYNDFVSLGRLKETEDHFGFELMFLDNVEMDSEITHWMPLPEAPNDEGNDS